MEDYLSCLLQSRWKETMRFTVGFDLDLTLVDSRARIIESHRRAFADLGEEVCEDELAPLVGLPLDRTAAIVRPNVNISQFISRYRFHYQEPDAPPQQSMLGAREALLATRAAGGRVVVVSAKYVPAITQALTETDLENLVDLSFGERFAAGKTSALQQVGAAVYVGDHEADIAAALAVPAIAVGVATGPHTCAQLTAAGAHKVLANLLDYPQWLRCADSLPRQVQ